MGAHVIGQEQFSTSILEVRGAVGSHTGDSTRTSVHVLTIPGGTLGPEGALELWLGARVDAATSAPWIVEVEFGGQVIASWQQAAGVLSIYRGRFIHNQKDDAVQVCAPADDDGTAALTELTVDTSGNVTVEVFVQLHAADTARTITVYGWLARALRDT